jgi:hypothetical protein
MNKQISKRNVATGSKVASLPTAAQMQQVIKAFGENDVYYESSIKLRIDSDIKNKSYNLVDANVTVYRFSEYSDSTETFDFSAKDIFKIEEVLQDAKKKLMKICPVAASLCK